MMISMKKNIHLTASLLFLLSMIINACGSSGKLVIYNESNYAQLKQRTGVEVRFIDGRIVYFYRMEVIKTDDEYIYARCWANKNASPDDWKFSKRDVVITDKESGASGTGMYILSIGLMIGLLLLLNKILYD